MHNITIPNNDAHSRFHAEVEGFMENAADDDDDTGPHERLIDATAGGDHEYPVTFPLNDEQFDLAETVLENIAECDPDYAGVITLV
jgi:hypothetical protein